ncbi:MULTISPECIES: VOC family protein [Rathayibacter]|uniref:VOC family protein n=1 Tax=Rathayibacter TaxID=33886 RepID=UPI001B870689|nr:MULTISPECIES: VOC family protein [Rathayibacter]
MELQSLYPVVATDRVADAAAFYVEHLGFVRTFSTDWYVSLRRPGPPDVELAFVDATHLTIPDGFRHPVRGLLINMEVDDVDAEWQRLVIEGGLEPRLAIRSEPFGQRHFILADPAGVLIDLITEIPPADDYAEAFAIEAGTIQRPSALLGPQRRAH